MGRFWTQPDLEPIKQCQMVIILEQHLFVWFNKKDATLDYIKGNNLHFMWNGSVIHVLDDYDIVNVGF